ncbi:Hypothetical predicted protein [Octopus vulgaris]|uniref:Uncharacterized protein n=1 Tax=Octopus vulgaris TaxID=6645 RepID=A0AA36FHY3_OCTVU|nr:Hypothetical predicted protein [Octopus vulgaris]
MTAAAPIKVCDAVPKKSCDLEPVEVEETEGPVEGVMADAVVPCLEPLASRPLSLGAQDKELARSGADIAESDVPALCVVVAAVIEIADVLPSSNIDFANRTFLTIKCRYAIENLLQFFLVRNHSEVIVQIYYQKKTGGFAVVSKRKGFDCTVPTVPGDKKGVITCSKRYPSCEDATYYKCSTYKESSKSRLVRVRSFIKKLEFLNPPAEVNKLAIFRCSAYIGAPFGATDFLWSHETKHYNWIN